MRGYQIFNGRLVKEDQVLFPELRRAALFGDGIFETMRVHDNRIFFRDLHIERCQLGMNVLGLYNGTLDLKGIDMHVKRLSEVFDTSTLRLRLTVFRSGGGLYKPDSGDYSWMLEADALKYPNYTRMNNGLNVGVSERSVVCHNPTSEFKTISALNYVIAGRECVQQGYDDLVIKDENGFLAEATSSNIYFLNGNELLTPGTMSGCVNGVTRKVLLKHISETGLSIKECTITPDLIRNCKSMYLTNTVNGVQWVSHFNGIGLEEGPYDQLLDLLNKHK